MVRNIDKIVSIQIILIGFVVISIYFITRDIKYWHNIF